MAVRATPLFGRYTDAERIGAGETGEVYRATDSLLGRPVAVKLLAHRLAEDPGVRQRFIRGTLAAAPLSANPHVLNVYDVGERDAQAYVVMAYLPHGSLAERLQQEGAQQPGRVLAWLEQAAAALDAAHETGIAHGDVKPSNLLLDLHDNVQIADFGAGDVVAHMPHAAGDRYALAVVAFQLLTGRLPPGTGTPSVSVADPALPRELDPVFATALAPDPGARYDTCAEFVAGLREAFSNAAPTTLVGGLAPTAPTEVAIPPPPPLTVYHPQRTPRMWLRWTVVALVALAPLAAAWGISLDGGSTHHPRPARRHAALPRPKPAPRAAKASGASAAGPVGPTAAHALNDEGFALVQRGDYQAALPLLEQAVRGLEGKTGDPYVGYANYNLGFVLIKLGRCREAVPYLNTAKQIEPDRHEVDDALARASRCGGGS